VLTLSPAHIEKYLAAAETALTEALALAGEPKREKITWTPFDLRGKTFQKEYEARGIADKVRVDLVPNNGALDDHTLDIKTGGDYLVRIKVSGGRPAGGTVPRLRLYAGDLSRTLFEEDIDAPVDQPATIDFRAHLPAGKHPIRIVNAVPGPNPEARRSRASGTPNHFTGLESRVPWQIKFTDDDGQPIVPFLLLDQDRMGRPACGVVPHAGVQGGFLWRRGDGERPGVCARDSRALRRARMAPAGDA
jgi:hypothetical protein